MQMIDVLKRLAELDAQNPNIVSEVSKELATKAYNKMAVGDDPWKNRTGLAGDQSDRMKARMDKRWGKDKVDAAVQKSREQGKTNESLEECGMMPEMGMAAMPERPSTPATINMTAGSADELGSLLKDIVSLAGLNNSEPEMPVPLGAPSVLEPADNDMGPPEPGSAVDSMRSVIDKLNPADDQDGEEDETDDSEKDETKETVDSQPNPTMQPVPPGNQDPAGSPGAGDGRNMMNNPIATPKEETTFESLMSEYQQYIREDGTK